MFLSNWQKCNLFVKNCADTTVLYKTFPGIYSANCCNTRWIVVKSKRDVWQLRKNSGRDWAERTVRINIVLQGRCVRPSACYHLLKRLCKHSAINTIVLRTCPDPSTLNAGTMWDSANTKYILLPSSSDFVLPLKRDSWFNFVQYYNPTAPSRHRLMSLYNWFNIAFPLMNKETAFKSMMVSSKEQEEYISPWYTD
jgi:hypothetical protein